MNCHLPYTRAELMVVAAARRVLDGERVLVGVGLPNLAANLAKRSHAPNMVMIYESGIVGANASRMPLTVVDPGLVTNASSVCTMFELFCFYLQRGLIDVGFLGGAQIDRFGNINSTVIGSYDHPRVRLPGSGGSCEIATHAKRILVLCPHQRRRFPEKVDFVTCPGYLGGRQERRNLGLPGCGPDAVVTDLGVLEFDAAGEMTLASLHPGVAIEQVQANTGWPLKVSCDLATTAEPTVAELTILREQLDPQKRHLKAGE